MPVSAVYILVVLIWSTTPLGIVWSSESVNPMMAVLLRMIMAVAFGWVAVKTLSIKVPWHAKALRLYCYSCVGIFGGLLFAYLASSYLPSGVMSLVFGLAPLLSGVLSQKILNEDPLSWVRKLALLIALMGLAIVMSDNLALGNDSLPGLIFILLGTFFFSLSGVLVKSIKLTINPMATTVGGLTVALPLFFLSWLILDGTAPVEQWQARSLWAIVYLGLGGSLIGFVAYFYVLQRLPASTVAMVALITPVIALALGSILNNETITINLVIGAACVTSGLSLYNWGEKWLLNKNTIADEA